MRKWNGSPNWKPENCQSLLGYAKEVHENSGGICEYCGYKAADFKTWRQLSLEHVIPDSWIEWERIREVFDAKKRTKEWKEVRETIARACCVTACHFCNSMTSRYSCAEQREKFHSIFSFPRVRDQRECCEKKEVAIGQIKKLKAEILQYKKKMVKAKLECLERHYEEKVKDFLRSAQAKIAKESTE